MNHARHPAPGATLDPTDRDAAATLAHGMLDNAVARPQGLRDWPVWQSMRDDFRATLVGSFHNPTQRRLLGVNSRPLKRSRRRLDDR
jgi:hypothetical protein